MLSRNGARFFHRVFICWPFTWHLLKFLSQWGSLFIYQACGAGEGIIGHRGIRFFRLSVCLSVVCLSVCLSACLSVCLPVIKLLPAYGAHHYQIAYTGSLHHCEDQSRFDIDRSPISRPQRPPKNDPQNENFYFLAY